MGTPKGKGAPDLTHADYFRLRAEVAQTQGWQVRVAGEEDAPVFSVGDVIGLPPNWRERDEAYALGFLDDADGPETCNWEWLPNYPSDPAAWGALMEKELDRWETGTFGPDPVKQHRFWYRFDEVTMLPGPWREKIGEAASLAVCAKYGKEIVP